MEVTRNSFDRLTIGDQLVSGDGLKEWFDKTADKMLNGVKKASKDFEVWAEKEKPLKGLVSFSKMEQVPADVQFEICKQLCQAITTWQNHEKRVDVLRILWPEQYSIMIHAMREHKDVYEKLLANLKQLDLKRRGVPDYQNMNDYSTSSAYLPSMHDVPFKKRTIIKAQAWDDVNDMFLSTMEIDVQTVAVQPMWKNENDMLKGLNFRVLNGFDNGRVSLINQGFVEAMAALSHMANAIEIITCIDEEIGKAYGTKLSDVALKIVCANQQFQIWLQRKRSQS